MIRHELIIFFQTEEQIAACKGYTRNMFFCSSVF